MLRNIYAISLTIFLGLSLTACNSHTPEASHASTLNLPKAAPVNPATAASISGTVDFDGTPPRLRPIDMSNDPGCKEQMTESEQVVVDNGHLANVLVYVKQGLPEASYHPPKQSVSIKQEGCRYVPHMAAIMVGQPVIFEDADQTLHNIHAMPRNNQEWNQSQMPNSQMEKSFSQPELMIPVKCNQHPWMHMYLSVMGNPYFAITDKDGKFILPELPPGTYMIAAVQEKYGEKTQTITVGAREDRNVSFSYQP